jgi:hypothetical protein
MIKPKRKRPTDTVQLAHSVFADVIKLSEKPIKAPARPTSNHVWSIEELAGLLYETAA